MSKNKSLGSELNVSLASKIGNNEEPIIEKPSVSRSQSKRVEEGFAAVSARLTREISTRATIATTVRLPEESDRALKAACAEFQKSKADLMKVCVEEFLKSHNFLRENSASN